jgi:CheY-like chemotaxis protein
VFVVDDDPDELFLSTRALLNAGIQNPIQIFADGAAAISYLETIRDNANLAELRPCLLVLDVKMSPVTGLDVLEWIRNQPTLANTRVVMQSNYDATKDTARAAELGAERYLLKPVLSQTWAQLLSDARTVSEKSR